MERVQQVFRFPSPLLSRGRAALISGSNKTPPHTHTQTHSLMVNSFVRLKLAHVGFCIPVLTNERDIKSLRTLHSLFWGHFNLFLAKHNNKAPITGQPLLRFFFKSLYNMPCILEIFLLLLAHHQEQWCMSLDWIPQALSDSPAVLGAAQTDFYVTPPSCALTTVTPHQ